MKICVLGTHAFDGEGPKVGTQHIAEALARAGHEVTYLTAQASWVTLFFAEHRRKYLRTLHPVHVEDRLTQFTPTTLFPMRALKRVERLAVEPWLMGLNRRLEGTRARRVEQMEFDLCIFSASSSMTLLPKIRARRYIYRQNDVLEGFEAAPRSLLDFEHQLLSSSQVWAVYPVNEDLARCLHARYPHLRTRVIPNGVDLPLFRNAAPDPELLGTRGTNVIYVGIFNSLIDVELIWATARLLPDHSFHLYGTWYRPVPAARPPNVIVYGPIRHDAIARKMKACSVGLIASGPANAGRLVEKPLKYYEYLAAGLGVAATSWGGKRLEPFAVIGDTPDELARAILEAKCLPGRNAAAVETTLQALDWSAVVNRMMLDWQ
jgi:glycosyltransferase involved in cell wall biosynthesis